MVTVLLLAHGCMGRVTVSGADVEPVVDFKGARFTRDSGGHRLVRVILVFRQENIQ